MQFCYLDYINLIGAGVNYIRQRHDMKDLLNYQEQKVLFRVAGWAAITAALLVPISLFVFVKYPPPYDGSAADWFNVFNDNPLIGLISTDILLLFTWFLLIPIYLAISIATFQEKPLLVISGVVLFIIAMSSFIGANPSVEMHALSNQYINADATQKSQLLGAGEAVMARFDGTAFHASYIIGQLAGIILGIAMLKNALFKKTTAWLLIAGNVIGYALYLPVIGLTISALSGMVLWIWFGFIAHDLLKASNTKPKGAVQ